MILYLGVVFISLCFNVLTASSSGINNQLADDIIHSCGDKRIILFGDSHDRPEGKAAFLSLIKKALIQGEKVYVALEIPEENQDDLEKALNGQNPSGDWISSKVIDTAEYRALIRSLGKLETKYPLTIKGIDTDKVNKKRDPVMYRNINHAFETDLYDKIFVFVGSIHTLKDIKWHQDVIEKTQFLGGLLREKNQDTCNIVQLFNGGRNSPLLMSTTSKAGSDAAMQVIRAVNHSSQMAGKDVADFVIIW
ncbi:MAG: ChaN family lipoprotein [Desulfobulbaceae bacterium]|nr:ChaN family lipoprotein [Desulfobulbaceae bacterium]